MHYGEPDWGGGSFDLLSVVFHSNFELPRDPPLHMHREPRPFRTDDSDPMAGWMMRLMGIGASGFGIFT